VSYNSRTIQSSRISYSTTRQAGGDAKDPRIFLRKPELSCRWSVSSNCQYPITVFFLHERYVSVVMLCRNEGLAHFNFVKTSKYEINYSLIDGWTCITKIWEKSQNSRRQKVTRSVFHTEDLQILGFIVNHLFATVTCRLEFLHCLFNHRKLENIIGIFDVTTD